MTSKEISKLFPKIGKTICDVSISRGYVCTRTKNHKGAHVARIDNNYVCSIADRKGNFTDDSILSIMSKEEIKKLYKEYNNT